MISDFCKGCQHSSHIIQSHYRQLSCNCILCRRMVINMTSQKLRSCAIAYMSYGLRNVSPRKFLVPNTLQSLTCPACDEISVADSVSFLSILLVKKITLSTGTGTL